MAEQPTGTVTLLFTDIEGSTRLLERLGPQRYAEALGLHRLLLRREFEVHGGYEVDYEGDAFFVAFARAADAVAAASDGQIALAHADWPDGQEIRVRMGIHTGEPLAAPPKYVGLDVHKAARIMAAGHGGQVLLSEATTRLLDGAETVGLGEHRLKDLLQAEPLYQLVVAGLPLVFPALKTLGNRPTNLPVQPNPLIGRAREVGDLVALLRAREVRLVTLTGPGGTGKTRLALQGAAEVMDDFPSGVFFVSLAPIRVADLVLPSIALALAVREVPGEEIAESVAAYLESKQMLLVLDNFEQVVDAAAQLEALQQRAPKLTLLVTSRERLRLKSEHTYAVSPLTVADPALSVGELCENEAVALFIDRARALTGEFALSEEGMAAVAEITARLDGLPLAIELAAARTTSLTPQALLRRLDQRLPLLTGGARDADERQRTLRATVDWSYELLGAPEQELSARLSVFVDGCRIDAVEAVCDLDGKLGIDLLDRLSGLVEKSLLRHRADPDQEPRYWMLETIREYAAELLRPSAEEELRRRHAGHYLALAERAEPHLWVGQEEAWFLLLDSEQANFRKALEWLTVQEEATGVLRLATALYRYWEIRARYTEAIGWLTGGLTLGGDSISTELRAQALMGIGRAARFQCDWRVATESLEESAAYFRALQDERGISRCLGFLGHVFLFTGDVERAADVLAENVQVARRSGDVASIAAALYNLAFADMEKCDFADAREHILESLRIWRSLGNKQGPALGTINLGYIALLEGDYDRAAVELSDGLNAAEEVGAVAWTFIGRRYLGLLALLRNDLSEAERLLTSAFLDGRDRNAGEELAYALDDFAALAAAKDDPATAATLWGAADAQLEALGLGILEAVRQNRERFMPLARRVLGESSWTIYRERGYGMAADEAAAHAVAQQGATPEGP